MSVSQLLTTLDGRIGRKTYWLWTLCYYLILISLAVIIGVLAPTYSHVAIPMVLIVLFVPDLMVTVKRWHDRNKSKKWLWLSVPVLLGRVLSPLAGSDHPVMFVVTSLALVCGLWILVECGFKKGTQGDNQYGDDPLIK